MLHGFWKGSFVICFGLLFQDVLCINCLLFLLHTLLPSSSIFYAGRITTFSVFCDFIMPSTVWDYFKKADDRVSAQCQLCNRSIKNKGGNTSNLFGHLRSLHPRQHTLITSKKKPVQDHAPSSCCSSMGQRTGSNPTIPAAIKRLTDLNPGQDKWEDITHAISYHLEQPGFKLRMENLSKELSEVDFFKCDNGHMVQHWIDT